MATITEDYVSFETAKLLKEKGFNEPTLAYAYGNDMMNYYSKPRITDISSIEAGKIPMPTIQMAMKWLREVHNIFIEISVSIDLNGKYHYSYSILNRECKYVRKGYTCFDWDYKQACEAALKCCLEHLI